MSPGDVSQLLASATLAGAGGALLGAGLAAVVRNVGGAVPAALMVLFVTRRSPPDWSVARIVDSVNALRGWYGRQSLGRPDSHCRVGSDPGSRRLVTVRRRDVV